MVLRVRWFLCNRCVTLKSGFGMTACFTERKSSNITTCHTTHFVLWETLASWMEHGLERTELQNMSVTVKGWVRVISSDPNVQFATANACGSSSESFDLRWVAICSEQHFCVTWENGMFLSCVSLWMRWSIWGQDLTAMKDHEIFWLSSLTQTRIQVIDSMLADRQRTRGETVIANTFRNYANLLREMTFTHWDGTGQP
jgi:hypothetical protein